jgi:hypothetical protein
MSSSTETAARSTPPPGLPGPGDVIAGKYLVERIIGMGGMGIVLAARHLELDETVAIKMLLPHLPSSGEPAMRFVREAKAAIKIRNEHVVRILDVARTPAGLPYIVMEYLEGLDLGQLVEKNGPLLAEDAVEYVLQACEAIAAAHAMGIVHRDLKPANLFLARASDGAPCVKVLDFGISKLAEGSSDSPGLTSTATVMGTPCFMSPEQLRSTRDVDARADIWSMGAILHALLTGSPPYDGESNADVSAKIIRDEPTPLRVLRPGSSESLEAAILKCLQKDPEKRYADVASLADALAAVVARESTKAAAARVSRIASGTAATAATVRATSDPDVRMVSPLAASGQEPTRTSSAWGETRREERRKRRVAWGIVAAGLIGGVTVFAALRAHTEPAPGVPAAAGPPAATGVTVQPPQPVSQAPLAVAPSATAQTPAMSPIGSASVTASARPPGGKGFSRATAASAVPVAPSSAKPAVTAPPPTAPTSGLFDGRE